jgi:radical SAM protein with 4Fe4S-binding SPASM domain
MGALMQHVWDRALEHNVPLSVQFDLTYRCNERCVHCYLDHDDHGEVTTAEVRHILDQLAEAGTLFLIFSGGELLLRPDLFDLLAYARALRFDVKLKTNGILLREREADRIRAAGVREVQISIYSHRADVHDAITKVPGSLERSIAAIRHLKSRGLRVLIANVLMRQNAFDYSGVRALAAELGVDSTVDPTITPKMDGDTSILSLRVAEPQLLQIFRDRSLVPNDFCTPPSSGSADAETLDALPCSAGHTALYISPYGEVYPCVQFPLPTGNLRHQRFDTIWRHSPQLADVRSIRVSDLPTCSSCGYVSSCTRCPGLAYMEGNMRGPSSADCEKSSIRAAAGAREVTV